MTMTVDDMVFVFCSNGVFIPWLALIFAPKWKYTSPITHATVLISCVIYTYYFGTYLYNNKNGALSTYADMGTLTGIEKLFSDSSMHLPAWVHYLAFDLMVGHYLVQKNMSDTSGLSKLAMAPCLFLCCMAGPAGVVLYVVLRKAQDLANGKSVAGVKID